MVDVEEDAVAERSFHARLVQIDADMHCEDIKALKFLCKDRVVKSKLAGTKSALEVFGVLENSRLMSAKDPWILVEIFNTIGRLDLVDHLDIDENKLKTFKTSGKISKYRHCLFDVAQDMTAEDTKKLCFLCEKIPRGRRERVAGALDLFSLLEESKLLSPTCLQSLLQHLADLGRCDLVHRIQVLNRDWRDTAEWYGGAQHGCVQHEEQENKGEAQCVTRVHREGPTIGEHSQDVATNGVPVSVRLQLGKELCGLGDAKLSEFWAGLGYSSEAVERIKALGPWGSPGEVGKEAFVNKMLECAPLLCWNTEACLLKLIHVTRSTNLLPLYRQLVASFKDELADLPGEYLREVEAHNSTAQGLNMQVSTEEASAGTVGSETEPQAGLELERDESFLPLYKMDAKPRGICVIFNNQHFTSDGTPNSTTLKDRIGSQIDAEKLKKTFEGLQFDVTVATDRTAQDMLDMLQDISKEQVKAQHDCFVCCVLTHGKTEHIYGSDGHLVAIRNLMALFRATTCPQLAGKPKLFFLQACQGSQTQEGLEVEADGPGQEVVPDEADFLLGYATAPRHVSYRSKSQGSWYIDVLTSQLEKHAHRLDLLSILTLVNHEVCKKGTTKIKQTPAPQYTLRRKLVFKKLNNQ